MDKLNENECTDEQIISNYCSDKEINENQIELILDYLEKTYVNINLTDKDVIVKTKNVLFEVCSHETQKNNNNPDISSVDLGECENKLKSYYKIDEDLIILKTDIKSSDLSKTFVQYQVYNPYDLTPLKLDICKEEKIIISAPVKLDESVSTLYDSLKESGYNLFNESDKFYTDICSSYTSEYGTDMILEDRKDEILLKKANVSLCQENCKLLNYSSSTNKAQCECSPQIEKIDSGSIYSDNRFTLENLISNFETTLKSANFRILACYKLAFDFHNFFLNIGRIIMTIIIILHFVTLIVLCFYDFKNVDRFLIRIITFKNNYFSPKKKRTISLRKSRTKKEKKRNIFNIIKSVPPKKKNVTLSNKMTVPDLSIKGLLSGSGDLLKEKRHKKKKKDSKVNINIIPINNFNYKKRQIGTKIKKKKSSKKLELKKTINDKVKGNNRNENKDFFLQYLNDQELNTLEYESAIQIDKRKYIQYYWSLLKKKNILLFTFFPSNDYNLMTIKICLLLTSFSLYMTINGFFFTKIILHDILISKGVRPIVDQVPQIIYSSAISSIVNMILRNLSLIEQTLIDIKKNSNMNFNKNKRITEQYKKEIFGTIKCRFFAFFSISYILLFFFWYFISCFCAVYINTQIMLIKYTCISYFLSMLYTFCLCLIPGIFRISALRAPNKDKKAFYRLSNLIALVI